MILANKHIQHIHCLGIGGIGVSAIAEILLKKGYHVSGSDVADNKNTVRLKNLGAHITLGHAAANIQSADVAVYSSAIAQDNPELIAAKNAQIPLYPRGQFLAELMRDHYNIVVAGTHGKTTTTGMIVRTLVMANQDPSFAVGGILNDINTPAHVGQGRYFVAEADESDASFLFMNPHIAVVTNIDADHLETYGGSFERLQDSFLQFLIKLPPDGVAVLCLDDPVIRRLIPHMRCRTVTYGFSAESDFMGHHFLQTGLTSQLTVEHPHGMKALTVSLNLPGEHNALNALATIAVAQWLHIEETALLRALAHFPGVGRRFHCHGTMQVDGGKALVIEDYGHHPNEIRATLCAARRAWPTQRIVLVFQPHRYTRTRDLMNDFVNILGTVDVLILLEVYSAGEKPIAGADGQSLYQAFLSTQRNPTAFVPELARLPETLKQILHPGDIVILQGAGNIGTMAVTLTQTHG